MTDAELFMKMRASFKEAEAFVEAAADRIEAQAAEIERLRGEKEWIMKERDRTFALVLARAEMAEAKLAKAVEALKGESHE